MQTPLFSFHKIYIFCRILIALLVGQVNYRLQNKNATHPTYPCYFTTKRFPSRHCARFAITCKRSLIFFSFHFSNQPTLGDSHANSRIFFYSVVKVACVRVKKIHKTVLSVGCLVVFQSIIIIHAATAATAKVEKKHSTAQTFISAACGNGSTHTKCSTQPKNEAQKKLKKKYRHDTLWLIIQHINKHLTVCRCNRVRISLFGPKQMQICHHSNEARAHLRISCVQFFFVPSLSLSPGISISLQARSIIMQYGKDAVVYVAVVVFAVDGQ